MLLKGNIKLGIPEQVQENDEVKPWVMLNQVLPVLEVAGIKEGEAGCGRGVDRGARFLQCSYVSVNEHDQEAAD